MASKCWPLCELARHNYCWYVFIYYVRYWFHQPFENLVSRPYLGPMVSCEFMLYKQLSASAYIAMNVKHVTCTLPALALDRSLEQWHLIQKCARHSRCWRKCDHCTLYVEPYGLHTHNACSVQTPAECIYKICLIEGLKKENLHIQKGKLHRSNNCLVTLQSTITKKYACQANAPVISRLEMEKAKWSKTYTTPLNFNAEFDKKSLLLRLSCIQHTVQVKSALQQHWTQYCESHF